MGGWLTPTRARVLGVAALVAAGLLAAALLLLDDGSAQDQGDGAASLPDPATVDGVTLTPVARLPGATALSVVDGEIRVTDPRGGRRLTIDGTTGEVTGPTPFGAVSRRARAEPDPEGDDLWVAEGRQLLRLAPASGEVVGSITLQVPGAVTAVSDEAVWLTVSGLPDEEGTHGGGTLSYVQRVDAATGEVRVVPLEDPATARFALTPDAAWVTVGRTLYRLDPTTTEVTGEIDLGEPAVAVEVADGVVHAVVESAPPAVERFDASSLDPLEPVDLGPGDVGGADVLPGDHGTEIWVARPADAAISRVTVETGDVHQLELALGEGPVRPVRVAVDAAGRVWILTDEPDSLVLRLDLDIDRHALG